MRMSLTGSKCLRAALGSTKSLLPTGALTEPLSSTTASTMEQALATHAGSEKDGVAGVAAEGAAEVDCWW